LAVYEYRVVTAAASYTEKFLTVVNNLLSFLSYYFWRITLNDKFETRGVMTIECSLKCQFQLQNM